MDQCPSRARPESQFAKLFRVGIAAESRIPPDADLVWCLFVPRSGIKPPGPGSHLVLLAVAAEPFLKDASMAQLLDASDAHVCHDADRTEPPPCHMAQQLTGKRANVV